MANTRYSVSFERDFAFYLRMRHKFNFDGTSEYLNKKGEKLIQSDPKGVDGKRAFYAYDSEGKILKTRHPLLLHTLLKTKGSTNLHIRMFAEDRAHGRYPGIEFDEYCKEIDAPDWFHEAVESQKYKYYPETPEVKYGWIKDTKMENLNTYEARLLDGMFSKKTKKYHLSFKGENIQIDHENFRFNITVDSEEFDQDKEAFLSLDLGQIKTLSKWVDGKEIVLYRNRNMKLTLVEYEFLKNEVIRTMQDYSELRLGQAWFNELVANVPEFGWIRTTKLDPFFRDEVLLDLFFHILDEEAYASWTHSDDYKRLHKAWVDSHPATPVDTSGSELSDFVDAELMLEYPVETISGSALEQWAEEDAVFEKEYIKAKDLLMENTITNASTSNTLMSTGTGSDTFLGNAVGSTAPGLEYSGNYVPVETTNVRLNITTTRTPLECVELLKQVAGFLGTLEDVRVRNLEISQW